jgi:hypothetical protein
MRLIGAAGLAALCLWAGSALAADMAVKAPPKQAVVQEVAPATEPVCLKWVEQTYSWYNYCDRVPYYSRHRYDTFAGFF